MKMTCWNTGNEDGVDVISMYLERLRMEKPNPDRQEGGPKTGYFSERGRTEAVRGPP
jgi:hypothetical protein